MTHYKNFIYPNHTHIRICLNLSKIGLYMYKMANFGSKWAFLAIFWPKYNKITSFSSYITDFFPNFAKELENITKVAKTYHFWPKFGENGSIFAIHYLQLEVKYPLDFEKNSDFWKKLGDIWLQASGNEWQKCPHFSPNFGKKWSV